MNTAEDVKDASQNVVDYFKYEFSTMNDDLLNRILSALEETIADRHELDNAIKDFYSAIREKAKEYYTEDQVNSCMKHWYVFKKKPRFTKAVLKATRKIRDLGFTSPSAFVLLILFPLETDTYSLKFDDILDALENIDNVFDSKFGMYKSSPDAMKLLVESANARIY